MISALVCIPFLITSNITPNIHLQTLIKERDNRTGGREGDGRRRTEKEEEGVRGEKGKEGEGEREMRGEEEREEKCILIIAQMR